MKFLRTFVLVVLSGLALLAFAGLHAYAIYRSWRGDGGPWTPASPLPEFASALTGLVTSIVAVAFTLEAADKTTGKAAITGGVLSRVAQRIAKLFGDETKTRLAVAMSYVLVYVLVAGAAGVTWILRAQSTPELLKTVSLVALGTLIAILQGWFGVKSPDPTP